MGVVPAAPSLIPRSPPSPFSLRFKLTLSGMDLDLSPLHSDKGGRNF